MRSTKTTSLLRKRAFTPRNRMVTTRARRTLSALPTDIEDSNQEKRWAQREWSSEARRADVMPS